MGSFLLNLKQVSAPFLDMEIAEENILKPHPPQTRSQYNNKDTKVIVFWF